MSFIPIDEVVRFAEDALARAEDMQQLDTNNDCLYAAFVGDGLTYTLSATGHNHDELNGPAASWHGVPIFDFFANFAGSQERGYTGPTSGGDTGWITIATYDGWVRSGSANIIIRGSVLASSSNTPSMRFQLVGSSQTDISNVVAGPASDQDFTLPLDESNWNNIATVNLQVRHETPVNSTSTRFRIDNANEHVTHYD